MPPADTHVPPQNIEAEESVLGAMLINEPTVSKVVDEVGLVATDFYLDRHRAIFEVIHALHAAGKPVDSLSVAEALTQRNMIDTAGGKHYVSELAAKVPAAGNAKHHAEIVKGNAELYRLLGAGQDIVTLVHKREGDEPAALYARALARLEQIRPPAAADAPKLLAPADLAALDPPGYLLEDLVTDKGFNVLFGPSGCGKTFLQIDCSLCIAYGVSWWGRAVTQGHVVYIAAEGAHGIYSRLEAWKLARGITEDTDAFHVFPEAVNFFSGETGPLVAEIDRLPAPPALVVVDTMARCMVGGEENSARDVGLFIDGVDRVRRRYGAAASVIHHTGKNGELERGSTALRGAADTMIALRPDGADLKLTCEKQKEAAPFDPWTLHLETSADSVSIALGTQPDGLGPQEAQLLQRVSGSFGTQRVSASKVRDVADLPKSSFYRALKSLCDADLMAEHPINDRRSEYSITDAGLASVPTSPKQSQDLGPVESQVPPPFRGGTHGTQDSGRIEEAERIEEKFGVAA